MTDDVVVTYIGGPTALVEFGGLRLLTDPTFDAAGSEYPTPIYTLRKLEDPAVGLSELGRIDAVLLSHDHHFDNLDRSGRDFLASVPLVLTTEAGAERLGGNAVGLANWQEQRLTSDSGSDIRIMATPARHGPVDGDRGPVIGFALTRLGAKGKAVYISGDTVFYEGISEVARRFEVRLAMLFMGAAIVREVGPAHLTFTAAEAVNAAKEFPGSTVIPLHYEGWAHFSESRADIDVAFEAAGLGDRLLWPERGRPFRLKI
jgi:L-ascorbate metabolism protein UlaG (beta-lactamase superfamily)